MFHRYHHTYYSRGKKTDPEIKKLQYKFIRSISKKSWDSAENLKTIAQQISFIKGYIDWQGDDRTGPNTDIDADTVSNICFIIETLPMNQDVSYSDDLYALSLLPALDKIIFNIGMTQNNPMSGSRDYFIREENIKAFQTLKAILIARLSLGFGSYRKDYVTADQLALLARQNTLISIKKAVAAKKLQVISGKDGFQKISSDSAREWLVTSIKNQLIPIRNKDQLADLNAFIGLSKFNDFITTVYMSSKIEPIRRSHSIRMSYGVYVFYDAETNAVIHIGKSNQVEVALLQHIGRASRGVMRPFNCVIFEPLTTINSLSLKQSTALEEHLVNAETRLKFEFEATLVEMKREEFKNTLTLKTHFNDKDIKEPEESLAENKPQNKKLINTGGKRIAWETLKNSLVGGNSKIQTANRYQEKKEELIASAVWTQIDHNGETLEQNLASCLKNIINIQDATIEDFFIRACNKPFYANTRVDSGTAMVENIKTNIGFDVHTWGSPINVDITYAGGGYSNDNFSIQGDRAEHLELLGIGKSRLFVLQKLARFTLTEGHKKLLLPWEQIWDWNDFEDTIEAGNLSSGITGIMYNFSEVIGTFFGHITAMHVLTDFGGWVKCDLHLVRSINYLTGSNYPDVPNPEEAGEINLFCIQFLKTLYPNSSQMKKDELLTALRELDFMLLNISRQGLIPEIDNN